jgi:hypothetical protein
MQFPALRKSVKALDCGLGQFLRCRSPGKWILRCDRPSRNNRFTMCNQSRLSFFTKRAERPANITRPKPLATNAAEMPAKEASAPTWT